MHCESINIYDNDYLFFFFHIVFMKKIKKTVYQPVKLSYTRMTLTALS